MRVSLIKQKSIEDFCYTENSDGSYWIYDLDKNNVKRNLLSISRIKNTWILKSNNEVKILINGVANEIFNAKYYEFCEIYIPKSNETYVLYFSPVYDKTYIKYLLNNNISEITIGSAPNNTICAKLPRLASTHAKIIKDSNNRFMIQTYVNNGMYINKNNVQSKILENGDIIFLMGLKIIVVNNTFIINNPYNSVVFLNNVFSYERNSKIEVNTVEETDDIELYDNDDYFFRAPRFMAKIEHSEIEIDPPPEEEKKEDKPLLYTIGPMFTMGIISIVMAWNALSGVFEGTRKLSSAMPQLVMASAMLCSMLLWPMLNKNYDEKKRIEKEKERRKKYGVYIDSKRKIINEILNWQKKTLYENNLDLKSCEDIILNRKRSLWERKKDHEDFLKISIGIGDTPPNLDLKYPEQHFTMSNDNLRPLLDKLVRETNIIKNVPITFSLIKKYITAIVGDENLTKQFIDGLLLKIITFHSYEDVKIVVFTNEKNKDKWEYLKLLPFCWNSDNSMRFFAANSEDIMQVTTKLYEIARERYEISMSNNKEEEVKIPYYIILTDDFHSIRNNEFIKSILSCNINLGFTILINNTKLLGLPDECKTFINIDSNISTVFENELITENQIEFKAELLNNINIHDCCLSLSNLPIIKEDGEFLLPESLSFLELYNVGDIEQLNVISRWKNSNPVLSLASPVGINKNGDILKIDLHEKFHGPHGLIAGMTGSGKSEFIITYILSLAINFSPYEVQFVLIDYKGGGLAGAFYNNETGIKLPHLCGVITNLDTNEIKRNFASIESELKRRQKLFLDAREKLNESTIDIYKYQKFYRDGLLDEPMSHLFIISDEFAELKSQQPEFMEQLISTARIGRSLGVHLILATQKPSGVVNDQIWSNAKFKVCLRVQDKSDSNDMIKVPDAAMLKQAGRFYFQVGYNEYFTMGQAAYAGCQYYKTEKYKKSVDTSINFVDDIGYTIKSLNDTNNKKLKSLGEELPNVVGYLSKLALNLNIKVRQLWLERIPAMIYVDALRKKYNYVEKKFTLNPILGEYDDPSNQEQNLVTVNISNSNTIIYGMPGSGKTMTLNSIIYSLVTTHTSEEVNLYLIDFGAETLRMFSKLPQVGDIVLINDEDKLNNLFKMLMSIIDERKKLFLDYNGDYSTYIKYSKKTLPEIVIVINNFEVLKDTYTQFDEDLISLTREGIRYGIAFILTCSSSGGVRYKLAQNFSSIYSLQLATSSDYITLFGRTGGIEPSKISGRGLFKRDKIYEFQTAHFSNDEDNLKVINNLANILNKNNMPKAKKIPVLPDILNSDYMKDYITDLSKIPVGIYKENINIADFNYKNKFISLISGMSIDLMTKFVKGFVNILNKVKDTKVILIDSDNLFSDINNSDIVYYNERFDDVINKLYQIVEQLKNSGDKSITYMCVLAGLESLKSKLSKESQNKYVELVKIAKEINIFKIVIVDTIQNIKKSEYNEWFKENVTTNEAIYIGDGLGTQFTIKLIKNPRFLNESLKPGFGYIVKSGIPYIIKIVED